MSNRVKKIIEDEREIRRIDLMDNQGSHYLVGAFGVTKIVCYREYGEFYDIPFIAVYQGDEIWFRVSATKVAITYFTKGE